MPDTPKLQLSNITRIQHGMDENDLTSISRQNTARKYYAMQWSELISLKITDRVKQGFSAPDVTWFRGESIDYINSLLKGSECPNYEYLNPEYITKKLDEHTSGNLIIGYLSGH